MKSLGYFPLNGFVAQGVKINSRVEVEGIYYMCESFITYEMESIIKKNIRNCNYGIADILHETYFCKIDKKTRKKLDLFFHFV